MKLVKSSTRLFARILDRNRSFFYIVTEIYLLKSYDVNFHTQMSCNQSGANDVFTGEKKKR